MMAKIVGGFGYRVLTALTAEAALAVLASEKPDLIIVDGMMPGMNGTEFIRLCRANPDTSVTPIMLYSAVTDAQFAKDALAKGATEVWHKGVIEFSQIRERLAHYLR